MSEHKTVTLFRVGVLLAWPAFWAALWGYPRMPESPRRMQQAKGSASAPSTEVWARSVASVIADRNFYARFPKSQAKHHFAGLVGEVRFDEDAALLEGRDAEHGVLYLIANLGMGRHAGDGVRVTAAQIVMPLRGRDGSEVYPILLRCLKQRLRAPVWRFSGADEQDPQWNQWERGDRAYPYVVNLRIKEFSAAGFEEAGPGPWVVVDAGEEEGGAFP